IPWFGSTFGFGTGSVLQGFSVLVTCQGSDIGPKSAYTDYLFCPSLRSILILISRVPAWFHCLSDPDSGLGSGSVSKFRCRKGVRKGSQFGSGSVSAASGPSLGYTTVLLEFRALSLGLDARSLSALGPGPGLGFCSSLCSGPSQGPDLDTDYLSALCPCYSKSRTISRSGHGSLACSVLVLCPISEFGFDRDWVHSRSLPWL
uniref:Uncharacterized protein n=1 Tax=Cannabis sativa TaxID=3483 RepID=A0A803QDG7_CANSA